MEVIEGIVRKAIIDPGSRTLVLLVRPEGRPESHHELDYREVNGESFPEVTIDGNKSGRMMLMEWLLIRDASVKLTCDSQRYGRVVKAEFQSITR